MQLDLLPRIQQDIPSLEILQLNQSPVPLSRQLEMSSLAELNSRMEIWTSSASTRELRYSTHGIFRFFGKFPPPIARHLISTYCNARDRVLDPMCGSGTSGVEALLLQREAELADINPLSILLAKVKTRQIKQIDILDAGDRLKIILQNIEGEQLDMDMPGLKNPQHWFLDSTIKSLARLRKAIDLVEADQFVKDLLMVVFASVVRKCSRATTQQGRIFLDADTAIEDAEPSFFEKLREAVDSISSLPGGPVPKVSLRSAVTKIEGRVPLIICHPPYYNSYRYSMINSLEMSWLRINPKLIRTGEVREAFKMGKPEKVYEYLEDMTVVLKNLSTSLSKSGTLALMIGDTILRGKYVPVTKLLLERVPELRTKLIAVRVPKYTEATWVASQRRRGDNLGINLCDYVILLERT